MSMHPFSSMSANAQPSHLTAFGVNATTPPPTDPQKTMQRADEVNTVQRMLRDAQASAVILTGSPGVGKSTLAALLYQRMRMAKHQGLPSPRYIIWLTLGTYSTLPDIIAAILAGLNIKEPGLFMLKPEQQIATLLRALRRPQENALVILDQFELLLYPESNQGTAGRGVLPSFLDMLQTDLGASRVVLTSYNSPYEGQNLPETRVRSCLISRISLPEGVALLQQRGVHGSPEELSAIWQRCMGHVFALVLFSALLQLSGISLSYLMTSVDYQPMWAGDVTANLIASIYHFINPVQRAILHVLSLFNEPAPMEGVVMTITGKNREAAYSNRQSIASFEREMSTLIQTGIVQPLLNRTGVVSYTLHPALRQYVLEHFLDEGAQSPPNKATSSPDNNAQDPQRAALAVGHTQVAAYYRHLIQQECPPRNQRKSLHDIAPIIETIRHLCLGWRWQRACELLFEEQLHESMVQWGAWNTLIGLYTAMLPPFGVLLRHDEGLVASHVAMLYGRIGEQQQSKSYFDQALKIQRQINNQHNEATTLTNQAELLRIRGEIDQARILFEQALQINEKQQDANLRCIILHNLGLIAHQEKDFEQAQNYYIEALALAHGLRKQQYTGMILTNMGMLLYEEMQQTEAIALLLTALQLRQNMADPTAPMLERFLVAIEQKMGHTDYQRICAQALKMQPEVFARFAPVDMQPK